MERQDLKVVVSCGNAKVALSSPWTKSSAGDTARPTRHQVVDSLVTQAVPRVWPRGSGTLSTGC